MKHLKKDIGSITSENDRYQPKCKACNWVGSHHSSKELASQDFRKHLDKQLALETKKKLGL